MGMRSNWKKTAAGHLLALGAVVAVATPGAALAATQGSLGATSTGTVSISASVPARVRISGLADVAFTNQDRSEEHTSELQSLMRISYAVFCLKKKNKKN